MAMVNMNVNNLLNGKDSRWLQLEVCREFQRNKCSRSDTECKFAHPPANVEVQNGRVTACYDSIKGRCNREKPPCKYFHPPQHLKDQLLINGRNHLALKNALMQQMGLSPGQPIVPGQVPTVVDGSPIDPYHHLFPHLSVTVDDQFALMAANPYLTGMPQVGSTYSPYFAAGPIVPTIMGPDPTGVGSPLGCVQQTVVAQQKMPRSDRLEPAAVSPLLAPQSVAALEIGKKRPREQTAADTDLLLMDMKTVGSYYYDNFAFPGMMPYKRPAADKSGMPVYQPNATTYQQLMQIQQPFVPVSCEYSVSPISAPATTCASPSSAAVVTAVSDQSLSSAAVAAAAAVVSVAQQQQQQQQSQSIIKDDTLALPASTAASLSTLSTPAAAMPDPAALAKEVAQQNYAKAVKLAAANQAAAAAHHNMAAVSVANTFSHLNPVNYTGITLNKQTMHLPPPNMAAMGLPGAAMGLARYPQLQHIGGFNPAAVAGGLGGLNHLSNPYAAAAVHAAAMQNANLLNMARAAPPSAAVAAAAAQAQAAAAAAAAAGYPYSFMRSSPYASPVMPPGGAGFMGATATHYPYHTIAPTSVTQSHSISAAAAAAAAAAVQNNNNNVVMQPYKKLKTT